MLVLNARKKNKFEIEYFRLSLQKGTYNGTVKVIIFILFCFLLMNNMGPAETRNRICFEVMYTSLIRIKLHKVFETGAESYIYFFSTKSVFLHMHFKTKTRILPSSFSQKVFHQNFTQIVLL